MVEKWEDTELLLKIREENKELFLALRDLAELYQTNPEKAKSIIDNLFLLTKRK